METFNKQSHKIRDILSHFFPDRLIPEEKNMVEVLEYLRNHINPLYSQQARLLQRLCKSWYDTATMNSVLDRLTTPYEVYSYYRETLLNEESDSLMVVDSQPGKLRLRLRSL